MYHAKDRAARNTGAWRVNRVYRISPTLAAWVADHRGTAADLTAYTARRVTCPADLIPVSCSPAQAAFSAVTVSAKVSPV